MWQRQNKAESQSQKSSIPPVCVGFATAAIVLLLAGTGWRAYSLSQEVPSEEDSTASTVEVTDDTTGLTTSFKETQTTTSQTTVSKAENGVYPDGDYEVGVDLPAGTYLAVYNGSADSDSQLVLHISSSPDSSDSDAILNDSVWYPKNVYFQVTDGQYVHLSWATLYDVSKTDITIDPYKQEGMYCIGRDLPAGTYALEPDTGKYDDPEYATYTIYSEMASPEPVLESSERYTDGITVTVTEGQYLQCKDCHVVRPI